MNQNSNKPPMKDKCLPPSLIKRMSALIQSYPLIKSLYLIGVTEIRQEIGYFVPDCQKENKEARYEVFILVVSEVSLGDPLKFRKAIEAEIGENVDILSMHYTCMEFERGIIVDPFITQVATEENRLFSAIDWEVPRAGLSVSPDEHIREWESRITKAVFIYHRASDNDGENDEMARMALIGQCLLQGSCALVWSHWQWKPLNLDLDLLLKLSKCFSPIPDIILPKGSFLSKRMYHLLIQSRFNVLHNTEPLVSANECNHAHKLAGKYLGHVISFGEKVIRSMGEENYTSPVELKSYKFLDE